MKSSPDPGPGFGISDDMLGPRFRMAAEVTYLTEGKKNSRKKSKRDPHASAVYLYGVLDWNLEVISSYQPKQQSLK